MELCITQLVCTFEWGWEFHVILLLLCFVFGQDHMSFMLVMSSLFFFCDFPVSGITGTNKLSILISKVYICVLVLVFLSTTLKVSLNKPRCSEKHIEMHKCK